MTPRQLIALAGDRLPAGARRRAARFRYGPGVCKVDWALERPGALAGPGLPGGGHRAPRRDVRPRWPAARPTWPPGGTPERPFCLVAQPGVVDPTRAPAGQHTLWALLPRAARVSPVDMSGRIEAQIERFAPGFRDLILARSVRTAADMERYNPNYVGGDINGGAGTLRQTVFRPTPRWNPYRTALPGVYLCSASTPPGGGVHGMCGELGGPDGPGRPGRAFLRRLAGRSAGVRACSTTSNARPTESASTACCSGPSAGSVPITGSGSQLPA